MKTEQKWKMGNAYELIKELPSGSVDLVVTDPPYGYSFMGFDWDKAVPKVEIWQECLRVLKPGAFAFIMSSPRQDVLSQMIVRIGQAGFKTDFTSIYWTYASGFPKAMNIGKAIDKKAGRIGKNVIEIKREIRKRYEGKGMTISQFNNACGFEASGYLRESSTWASVLPSKDKWEIIKKVICSGNELDNTLDDLFQEAEREIIGKSDSGLHRGSGTTVSFGEGKDRKLIDITAPATPQAKTFEGASAGFQPKPAVEVVIVAMKPLSEKTYVEQALKNGKGITWLDNGRIPFQNKDDFKEVVYNYKGGIERATDSKETWKLHDGGWKLGEGIEVPDESKGRFPANLLVSDDVLNDGNISKGSSGNKNAELGVEGNIPLRRGVAPLYCDSGSYSRYFDLDKWFEETIKNLPRDVIDTFPFLIVGKPCKSEKNKDIKSNTIGCNNPKTNISGTPKNNQHPTVKPLKLFSYLITIGSRENDTILDPFLGSGTLLRACRLLNRNGIGFEIEAENELSIKGRSMSNIPSLWSWAEKEVEL